MAPAVRLIRYAAAAALLAGGGLVEAASDQSVPAACVDWFVGAAFVGVALSRRDRRLDPVALLAAALWYLATLALTPDGWWHGLDGPLALAYRGPVLHLLARPVATGRARWPLLVAAYGVPLLVLEQTGLLTALVAVGLAGLVVRRDRVAAALLGLLVVVWAATAVGLVEGSGATVVGGLTLVVVAAVVGWRHRTGALRVSGMVLELGQDDRPATPLSASLAEALGDTDLRIAVYQPGEGWRDDAGLPTAPPDLDELGGRVALAPVPGGGSLALVHGPHGIGDPDLSAAAARAAVLVLERVRMTTAIRLTADEVRRSAARLVAVDEHEREALAVRIAAGPRRRLARVRELLDPTAEVLAQLDEVDDGLDRLARGLVPHAVSAGALTDALGALAAGAGLRVGLDLVGAVDDLPEQSRALVWFVVAEGITNAQRHGGATQVDVVVQASDRLRVEVRDDGVGGASAVAGHGLQGLADRVTLAGGTLSMDSPAGGPTTVVADVPLDITPPAPGR